LRYQEMAQRPVTYTQPTKALARRTVLEHAVASLTTNRSRSALIRVDKLRTVLRYAIRFLVRHGFDADRLDDFDATFEQYLSYHREGLGRRKPSELKMLYLCGPEPLNDLKVLIDLGCRPQNIWALEKDAGYFASAVAQLREAGAFIRVHHGSLHSFFAQFAGQFDLVYFDGCGPLPGGDPNTLTPLMSLFTHDRLADLSALVTNFAEYPQEKEEVYVRLMAHYFAPRYNDVPRALWSTDYDPALAPGDPGYSVPFIGAHAGAVYSDFVTRLISDVGRSLVPWAKIGSSAEVMRKFFSSAQADASTWKDSMIRRSAGAIPQDQPLLAFLESARDDQRTGPIVDSLCTFQINGRPLLDAYRPAALLERAYSENVDLASPEMLAAIRTKWIDSKRQYFCDIPMPNLIFSMLAGVYGRPHFVNPAQSVRLSYTAKSTTMYSDALVFDRCRSFFDFIPSVELLPAFFRSASRQLLLRGCIDQIGWHDFSSDAGPFVASALGGMGEHSAAYAREFPERTTLTA